MQKLNLNFFQKSLSTRIESCLVPHKGQFSLDNQKILKLTKFDLKEVTEIILSFLEDPGNLQKHSSYLTIWKLLVENTLSKDLILVIKPEIVPGLVRGGSGKIFLLFLVDVTALYGSEHVNLALTTTTLIDALPVEEQAPAQVYGTPPIVQVGNIGIPKEPSPEDITMHFNKVNQSTEMFIEVLNFNQGNLGDNQLARELHTQLKDLKRVTDNWLATVGPSVDTSLLVACSEKILESFKVLNEMTKQDKLTAAEMNLEKARIEYEMALERSKLEQSHVQQSQPINQAVASNHASGSGLTPGSANDLMTFDGEDVKGKGKA